MRAKEPPPAHAVKPLPGLPCACAAARRAARLVTQLYGEHLRPYGLEATQLALLSALDSKPGRSQVKLARALGLDKTTLSRNLKLLETNGWVASEPVDGRREAGLYLTTAGQRLVKKSHAGWSNAQQQLRSAMTRAEWDAMWNGLHLLTRATHEIAANRDRPAP